MWMRSRISISGVGEIEMMVIWYPIATSSTKSLSVVSIYRFRQISHAAKVDLPYRYSQRQGEKHLTP